MAQPNPSPIPIRSADDLVVIPTVAPPLPRAERVALTYPLEVGDERITELVIRPLTTQDVRLCGDPWVGLPNGGGTRLDARIVCNLIAAATGLPLSTIDRLHPHDYHRAELAIIGFFQVPDGTS